MKCPECGAECWREEVDVGVGIITSDWMCTECKWDEVQGFPMTKDNWDEWLNEGPTD
jgi:hypothetical protein